MGIPSEFSYVSAATSSTPSICSLEDNMNFYSAPTSPISEFSSQTEPTTPTTTYEESHNFNLDDFEFDTSCRFVRHEDFESGLESETPVDHEPKHGDSLRAISFADELFCDGKVVPLAPPKLKLPPRLRGEKDKFGARTSGTAVPLSSPRTPRSVLKLPFSRQCLWNDDFDPFTVAIENVKEEKRGKMQWKNLRRARSLSPLKDRPNEPVDKDEPQGPSLENGLDTNGLRQPNQAASIIWESPKEETKEEGKGPMQEQLNGSALPIREGKSPKVLSEPKGVLIARLVRRAKWDPEKPSEPNTTPVQGSTAKTGNTSRESGKSFTRDIKRQKIMRLLFKSSSGKKVSDEEENKVKDQNAASWKLTFLSKLSFKSTNKTQSKKDKSVMSQVAKVTIVQYRPRLSLCIGYGSKYVE